MTAEANNFYICASCSSRSMAVKQQSVHRMGVYRKIVCFGCGHIIHTIEMEVETNISKASIRIKPWPTLRTTKDSSHV